MATLDLHLLEVIELEKQLRDKMREETPMANYTNSLTSCLRRTSIMKPLLPEMSRGTFVKHFLTRPRLNLSKENLKQNRLLAKLGQEKGDSISKYVRTCLDPSLGYAFSKEYTDSSLNPSDEPFMTILNNALHTFSGHPDPIIDTHTSKEGNMKEQWSYIDGIDEIYKTWDATLSFHNIVGEGVWLLLDTWIKYSTLARRGVVNPYPRYLVGRQIDSQSCCYTFVLENDGRTIKHTATTILFPTAISKGNMFDINKGADKRKDSTDVAARFSCVGAEYDDPISCFEFNKHVATFAPSLRGYLDGNIDGSEYYVIPPDLYKRFNSFSIPFVDLYNGTLERLVHKDNVEKIKIDLEKLLEEL